MTPWQTLKLLADQTRLRMIALLRKEELSVAELQEILGMGQSRISSHLSLLRKGGILADRRQGKKAFYAINPHIPRESLHLIDAACEALLEFPDAREDHQTLTRVIERRRRFAEQYFNTIAGRLGRHYCPGRSWEAIGHFLLRLAPPIVIADLGAGEGMISHLLAQRAEQVYCIDNSPQMVEVGIKLAKKHNIPNLTYKLGNIEDVPLENDSVDLAFLSQALHHATHPKKAIKEAFRIIKPHGQLIVLDLKEHQFEQAREQYADVWLGFKENTIYSFLEDAGFEKIEVTVVAKEDSEPYFQTLLANGHKPAIESNA